MSRWGREIVLEVEANTTQAGVGVYLKLTQGERAVLRDLMRSELCRGLNRAGV